MLGLDVWTILPLLVYSVVVTLGTDWVVRRLAEGQRQPRVLRAWALVATAAWMVALFFAGVLAVRYIERIDYRGPAYTVLGSVGILVSLLRASMFRSVQEHHKPGSPLTMADLIHTVTYLLAAYVPFLLSHWLLGRPVDPWHLLPLGIGAMVADLDSSESLPGKALPLLSRRLEDWLGSGQGWHSPAAALLVAIATAPLILLVPWQAWILLPGGFLAHVVVDMLEPHGAMLLWPWRRTRFHIAGGPIKRRGGTMERKLAAGLGLAAIVLLLVVDYGPPPSPPVAAPSYEQLLQRYYGLRGRNLVVASVQGTWQATGQRISGRFEILNARGTSYVMLDRYTGRIFTAGRNAEDHLYLNYIDLQTGAAVTIKPVEIHLHNQALGDALPVAYLMQEEAGLQYIYVSGYVVLPTGEEATPPDLLPTDYAPTELRRIQTDGHGRYTFQYVTAAQLVELSGVKVESAELVIFATYVSPANGPTATPLPSPAASG
jgi:membrane-bound metal-dependent hydrolase YbcI (DUF457 family)